MKLYKLTKSGKVVLCCTAAAAVCTAGILIHMNTSKAAVQLAEAPSATPSSTPTQTPSPTPTATVSAKQKTTEELNTLISTYLTNNDIDQDSIGIYIHDLKNDGTYTLNEDEYFTAASTYKLPLAVYYYEAVNQGTMSLSDVISYTLSYEDDESEDVTIPTQDVQAPAEETAAPDGSSPSPDASQDPSSSAFPSSVPTIQPTAEPVVYTATIEEALHSMILYSDNTAAEALFNNLGGWNAFKDDIRSYSPNIKAEQLDLYNSYDNIFTPSYMNDVLDYIYEHQTSFPALLADMLASEKYDYLNLNTGTVMAQKYGDYGGALNAIGLSAVGYPYTIAVYTYGLYNGEQVIGDLNEICYQYFNQA